MSNNTGVARATTVVAGARAAMVRAAVVALTLATVGFGTPAAASTGHPMRIDATALSNTAFQLIRVTPASANVGIFTTSAVQDIHLSEGTYTISSGSGVYLDCPPLTVGPSGTWDYAGDCDGFLSGRGTDTLVLHGHRVLVDARGLSNTHLAVVNLFGTPTWRTDTLHELTVLPTRQDLTALRPTMGSGLFCDCWFHVDPAGRIGFPTDFDSFLSGRGSDTLVLRGYRVSLDARGLSNTHLAVVNLFGTPTWRTDSVHDLTVLPTRPDLTGMRPMMGSGLLCDCWLHVDRAGRFDFPTDFDGFLSGRGSDTLVLHGYRVFVDARALSTNHFNLHNVFGLGTGAFDSNVVQPFTLLPSRQDISGYGFRYMAIATFNWHVDRDGRIAYAPAFDAYLAGRGSDTLRVLGHPVEVDATALGAGVFTVFNLTVGALDRSSVQPLTLVPATLEFFSHPIRFTWHVREDGTVDYSSTLDHCVRGRGSGRLTVLCDPNGVIVDVDIRPASDRNPVNVGSHGVMPVAILTTDAFDAVKVDSATVCFGDAEEPAERDCTEAHGGGHAEDVDGDGDVDLLLHYETAEAGIDATDTTACLTGRTFDGAWVRGCDAVTSVP